jgi:predicted kinase
MKKIIALSGISGVGKTYTRTHDPELMSLPCIDIADIYTQHPRCSPETALGIMINEMVAKLEDADIVVLEAYFRRNSRQRSTLEWAAESMGVELRYREVYAPIEVCRERIRAQVDDFPGDEDWERFIETRLKLLDIMTERVPTSEG